VLLGLLRKQMFDKTVLYIRSFFKVLTDISYMLTVSTNGSTDIRFLREQLGSAKSEFDVD
jgi:hypothetical protein